MVDWGERVWDTEGGFEVGLLRTSTARRWQGVLGQGSVDLFSWEDEAVDLAVSVFDLGKVASSNFPKGSLITCPSPVLTP